MRKRAHQLSLSAFGGHGAMRLCPPYNGTVEEQRYACGLTSDVAAMARERK
jgi:hypothetical protein